MLFRGKHMQAAFVLMSVSSVHSPTCRSYEYKNGNDCCPMCPPGGQVKIDCSETRSTVCQRCTDGTFMNKPAGRTPCFPCRVCNSGSGLLEKQPCTAASDTKCGPAEGFFCTDSTESSCAAAQKHRSCKPGQYISKRGTSSSDTECSDCSDGTFSDGSSSSCRPRRRCESENLAQIKAGTSSSDAECGEQRSSWVAATVIIVVVSVILIMGGLSFHFREKIKSLICGRQRSEAHLIENPVPALDANTYHHHHHHRTD